MSQPTKKALQHIVSLTGHGKAQARSILSVLGESVLECKTAHDLNAAIGKASQSKASPKSVESPPEKETKPSKSKP